eukprot:gene18246-28119_t
MDACSTIDSGSTCNWSQARAAMSRQLRRLVKCPDCKKAFRNSEALSRHRVTHTNAKAKAAALKNSKKRPRFECQRCGKSFEQQLSLELHVKDTNHSLDNPSNALTDYPEMTEPEPDDATTDGFKTITEADLRLIDSMHNMSPASTLDGDTVTDCSSFVCISRGGPADPKLKASPKRMASVP